MIVWSPRHRLGLEKLIVTRLGQGGREDQVRELRSESPDKVQLLVLLPGQAHDSTAVKFFYPVFEDRRTVSLPFQPRPGRYRMRAVYGRSILSGSLAAESGIHLTKLESLWKGESLVSNEIEFTVVEAD